MSLCNDHDRDSLIAFVNRLSRLRILKMVYILQRQHINAFNDFVEHMMQKVTIPMPAVRTLAITLQQETPMSDYTLFSVNIPGKSPWLYNENERACLKTRSQEFQKLIVEKNGKYVTIKSLHIHEV